MRLIYAYIKKFRNICNQEICFSNQYKVLYNPNLLIPEALTIKRIKPNSVDSIVFKNSKLSNVHIIVGKTGAGKTNILQMIGMPDEERTMSYESGSSYFLIYESTDGFVIEPFNVPFDSSVTSENRTDLVNDEESRMPERVKEHTRMWNKMTMYSFQVDDSGQPCSFKIIKNPNDLNNNLTFIVNGYERHAFPCCPYEEERLGSLLFDSKWQPRINAEYHKTSLWSSCRFLKEYINTFDSDNIKRKASLVIECRNWAEKIKQHIDSNLEANDYWTFINVIKKEEEDYLLGEPLKTRRKPEIRHQFVHDLWTDYALYLREWISYIQMYHEEITEDNLDFSGTKDIYQELWDYYSQKEQEDRGKKGVIIDPTRLPDYEKISIIKRIEWLSMWIDRRSEGYPQGLLYQICDDIKDIGQILMKFDNKYFTNDTFTLPIEDMYLDENKELISELFERIEQYKPDDIGIFTKELLPYHFSCISTGEYQLSKILGGLEEYCVKLSVGAEYGKHPNLIYLLDEPETYMHPELCRIFMKKLDSILQERSAESDIQIIISTHSPFILSDVLSEQITRLDLDSKGYCIINNDTEKSYFGANIHTILSDGFFLDYTIGEYARSYLQDKFDWMKSVLDKSELTSEDKEQLAELKTVINLIGDELIKNSFDLVIRQLGEKL